MQRKSSICCGVRLKLSSLYHRNKILYFEWVQHWPVLPPKCFLSDACCVASFPLLQLHKLCRTCPSWKKMVHAAGQFNCILQSCKCPHIFFLGGGREGWAASWWELNYRKFLYLRPKLPHRKYILHGKIHCRRGCGKHGNHNSGKHR